jgi:tRNA (mo5U34)-methyltransferase
MNAQKITTSEHSLETRETGGEPQSMDTVIERLGPWFQNLHLPNGIQTAPHHPLGDFPSFKWNAIAPYLPDTLKGWHVLDIGCNAGFYCFELASRGARVTGIDREPLYLAQAEWAARQFGLRDRVEFKQMQIYDLARTNEVYDLVVFMGLMYHLRYPLLGLDIVSRRVGKLLLFQTLTMPGTQVYIETTGLDINNRGALLEPGWPKMAFFEHDFAADETNWWAPNHACVEAMLRSSGLRILERPADEIYLCEPDQNHPSCIDTWNVAEFLAATGLSAPGDSGGGSGSYTGGRQEQR